MSSWSLILGHGDEGGGGVFSSEAFLKISDLLALSCIRWASVKTQGGQHVFYFFFLFFLDNMLIFWNAMDGSCTISILPNRFHMLIHKQVLLEASCYTRTRQRNNYLSSEWPFHPIFQFQWHNVLKLIYVSMVVVAIRSLKWHFRGEMIHFGPFSFSDRHLSLFSGGTK